MTARMDVIAQLEDLAAWFENPRVSPLVHVRLNGTHFAVGTVLRQIALNLESEGWASGTLRGAGGHDAEKTTG